MKKNWFTFCIIHETQTSNQKNSLRVVLISEKERSDAAQFIEGEWGWRFTLYIMISYRWFGRLFVISHHMQRSFVLVCYIVKMIQGYLKQPSKGSCFSVSFSSPKTALRQPMNGSNKPHYMPFHICVMNNTFSLLHLFLVVYGLRRLAKTKRSWLNSSILNVNCFAHTFHIQFILCVYVCIKVNQELN